MTYTRLAFQVTMKASQGINENLQGAFNRTLDFEIASDQTRHCCSPHVTVHSDSRKSYLLVTANSTNI